jgi:monoamine oxidase
MPRSQLFLWLKKLTRQTCPQKAIPIDSTITQSPLNQLSRRDFLKATATLTGAIMLSSWGKFSFADSAKQMPSKSSLKPVIIIGAGLGGLVTAYRLTQKGIPCEIYEASHRVGGRMFTRNHFNEHGMFVELGGELVDTNHEDLIGLCQELNIPLQRFKEPEAGIEPAIFFSEGKVQTKTEVLKAFERLAQVLNEDLAKAFPHGEVMIPTYQNPYNAQWLDNLSLEEYLDSKSGIPTWLIKVIKAAYTGEYGLDPQDQSALNLLLLIGTDTQDGLKLFGESDEAMRIEGGSSRLPEALYQAIQDKVPVHFGYKLKGVKDLPGKLQLIFSQHGQSRHREADYTVMAIPFTILREIQGIDQLGLPKRKLKAIREWGYGTNSKQMMGFRARFWLSQGQHYAASTGEFFTDWDSQCYWETSRLQDGTSGILTNFLGGSAGKQADHGQWKRALQDLDQLYQGSAQKHFSGHKAFMNWSANPLAKGSYTCPQPGQYTSLMGIAGEPELGGKLLFAGEHCSVDWAGFMNGAAESGAMAARQILSQMVWLETRPAFG